MPEEWGHCEVNFIVIQVVFVTDSKRSVSRIS